MIHQVLTSMKLPARAFLAGCVSIIAASATGAQQYTLHVEVETIKEPGLAYIAEALSFTDDQRDLLQRFWSEYHERADGAFRESASEAWELLIEAGSAANDPHEYDYEVEARFRKAFAKSDEAMVVLNALDEQFMKEVESLLDQSQLSRMDFIRWWRQRMLYRRDRRELPGGNVDLFTQLAAMRDRFDPELRVRIDAFRHMWEPQYVQSLADESLRDREAQLCHCRFREAFVRLREEDFAGQSRTHWVDVAYSNSERGAGIRLPVRDRIRDFNESRLRELIAILPADLGYELHTEYLEQSYPEVYPDPATAERLYAAALAIDDLSDDQRQELLRARNVFRLQHHHLSERLAAKFLKFRRESHAGAPWTDPYSESFLDTREEIGQRRYDLNARQVEHVAPILTVEQIQRLPEWSFEEVPRPRPWHRDEIGNRVTYDRPMHTPRPDHPQFDDVAITNE